MLWPAIATFERGAVACTGKRRGRHSLDRRRFNAGASERSRPLWPGMNATLTVSGGKHARVMKRVRVGQEWLWQRSARPQSRDVVHYIVVYIINSVNNVPVGQI